MSKYSDSESLPDISIGSHASSDRKQGFTNTDHAIGSVVEVLAGNDEEFTGVGDILATIMTDQGKLVTETLSPLNPHMFTIPLPNEKIHCIKDGANGRWWYTGLAAEKGQVNFLMNANHITYKPDTDIPHAGNTFIALPNVARSLDLYEGDVVVQGRFGQSLRLTGSNPNVRQPWESSTQSTSPITILRNGYLPTENFDTDSAGIWLTSDQFVDIPLQATLPPDIEPTKDKFGSGQVILFSDRIVIGSRTADILLSSKKTIAFCTQLWQHDVDIVLDTFLTLIEEVKKLTAEVKTQALASAQQTFPVPGVGSTLLSVQAPRYSTSFQNSMNIETKLMELKTNIEALKQK